MFDFFTKKYFLSDYLENFVDIHNHILPGIDDGAKTVENSLEMIRSFAEFGVEKFICTPHIMQNYYPNTPETIRKAFGELKHGLAEAQMLDTHLDIAAEHMLEANFDEVLQTDGFMPLFKNFILVETSFLQPPLNLNELLLKIASKRLTPILAHPERYGYVKEKSNFLKELKDQGILFQINLLSLEGHYGSEIQNRAFDLIDAGMIDFVASDAHRVDQIKKIQGMQMRNRQLQKVLPIINNTLETFY